MFLCSLIFKEIMCNLWEISCCKVCCEHDGTELCTFRDMSSGVTVAEGNFTHYIYREIIGKCLHPYTQSSVKNCITVYFKSILNWPRKSKPVQMLQNGLFFILFQTTTFCSSGSFWSVLKSCFPHRDCVWTSGLWVDCWIVAAASTLTYTQSLESL